MLEAARTDETSEMVGWKIRPKCRVMLARLKLQLHLDHTTELPS